MSREGAFSPSSSGKDQLSRMTPLAPGFVPGEDDVICGRGKKCYNHVGNTRFRQRVVAMLDEYANAKSKLDKSNVLSQVMDQVRRASPGGGFVKQDESDRWYEVGDFLAREKTSQAFRDALHERYKSSNISKKKRRQQEQAKASDKVQQIARSEQEMSSRLDRLSSELAGGGKRQRAFAWMHSEVNSRTRLSHSLFRFALVPGLDSQSMLDPQTSIDMISRLNRLAKRHRPSPPLHSFAPANTSLPQGDPRNPDPLFGRSTGSVNAAPASMVYGHHHDAASRSAYPGGPTLPQRSQSYSHPSPTVHVPERASLHNSLPNMNFSSGRGLPFSHAQHTGIPDLNLSLPNIDFFERASHTDFSRVPHQPMERAHQAFEATTDFSSLSTPNQRMEQLQMEPARIDPADRHKFKSEQEPASGRPKEAPSHSSIKASPPAAAASDPAAPRGKDLLGLLEKLTEHSISEDPFEPIPLRDDDTKKRTSPQAAAAPVAMDESSSRGAQSPLPYPYSPPPGDDSHGEFAEG